PPSLRAPIPHLSATSCEPGPLYWCMITGYFLFGLKFAGFIIQPFNSTPSLVLKLNSSLLGIFRRETWCFNLLLSTKVANSLPLLSLRVMTGGVLILEKVLM